MSPAKHSYASVTDRRTDRRTDRQTDDGQSDPYVSLCFAGDTISILCVKKDNSKESYCKPVNKPLVNFVYHVCAI